MVALGLSIVFIAPRFRNDGALISPARLTVFHNGVLLHHNVELEGTTVYRGAPSYEAHPLRLPLSLQDHGQPVSSRNIWLRELDLEPSPDIRPSSAAEGAPGQ